MNERINGPKNTNSVPVLVGIGQLVNRSRTPGGDHGPVDYMYQCALRALRDAGAMDVMGRIDSLAVIAAMSKSDPRDPQRLADKLGAHPQDLLTTVYGAVVPLTLTARLGERIANGESEIGLILGAEAFYSGDKPDWDRMTDVSYADQTVPVHGESKRPFTETERRYGLYYPATVYPLFANAYRYSRGLALEDYRADLGALCARYAAVAAGNEHAWSRDGKTAEQITTVSSENRMVHYPFTKFMNANMNVDQAAALLVMSEARADSLGIPHSKRVYLTGSSEVYDKWFVSDRVNYHSSPGLELAFDVALHQAGIDRESIGVADFYSCFPVAARIAIDTLGLEKDLVPTVTGGLPYFGGAGTHYSLHAICDMVRVLRTSSSAQPGLVQALSWFMSKFAVGIFSSERPAGFARRNPDEYTRDIDKAYPDRMVLDSAHGAFPIETYVVSFDRENNPARAVIVANDSNGNRLFAINDDDRALMASMTVAEPIGRTARVHHDSSTGLNRFTDID